MRASHALSFAFYRWAQDAPLAALAWIRDNADASPDLATQEAKPVSYTHLTLPTNREV